MDSRVKTIEDLNAFSKCHPGWLFRGHRDPAWRLETSLERAAKRLGVPQKDYEKAIVYEFKRSAPTFLHRVPAIENTLEWLALMQHYGAPTRLLDFTYSFWIALFFAFEEAENECVVFALEPDSLRQNQPGVDYNHILRENIDRGNFIDDFLYANVPYFTNERLAIQKGTFVFSLNLGKWFHDLFVQNEKQFVKLSVPPTLFPDIRQKLNEFNCNARTLFPGIDGYARYFRNHTW